MGQYRAINPLLWHDARFRSLTDRGRLLFLSIATHPDMTMLGAMRASPESLGVERRWSAGRLTEAFDSLCAANLIRYDRAGPLIQVLGYVADNPPASPNVVRSWPKAFALLPDCELKGQVLDELRQHVQGIGVGFARAFGEAFGQGCPPGVAPQYQYQYQKLSLRTDGTTNPADGLRPSAVDLLIAQGFSEPDAEALVVDVPLEYVETLVLNIEYRRQTSNPVKRPRGYIRAGLDGWRAGSPYDLDSGVAELRRQQAEDELRAASVKLQEARQIAGLRHSETEWETLQTWWQKLSPAEQKHLERDVRKALSPSLARAIPADRAITESRLLLCAAWRLAPKEEVP